MKSKLFLLLVFIALFSGAQAQTTYSVNLSWTAPASCTTAAPCTYAPYRLTGVCPGTLNVTTQPWTALPQTASQVVTANDATVTYGTTYCYFVESVQAGASSAPSSTVQAVIPGAVSPPTNPTATVITVTVTVQ